MGDIVRASDALAAGIVTRNDLRLRYAKVHRNVYVRRGVQLTARDRAEAAWLWSGRQAVLVGNSAAVLHGVGCVGADEPAELGRLRHAAPPEIIVRSGAIAPDELTTIRGMPCTTVARTAFDLGRRCGRETGIIRVDALLHASRVDVAAVSEVANRYPGARDVTRLRRALDLVDAGAESPQETRLRLVLVDGGLPRPETQIPVRDDAGRVVRRIDMGWSRYQVGVEYDGEQHFTTAADYENDIDRLEFLAARGWVIVRVAARHLRLHRQEVLRRTAGALVGAGMPFAELPPRLRKVT